MQRFKSFIFEATMSPGIDAERHARQYLDPHIGSENTHTLAKPHGSIPAGVPVTVHGYGKNENGKWHATISHNGKKEQVPFGKINKKHGEKGVTNKGFDYENNFVERLKKHGVMPKDIQAAGATGGTDFVVHNKKNKTMHNGTITSSSGEPLHMGETKLGHTAAFGQITIHHTPERGWHISDKARAKRPRYAESVESSGILDHMNANHPDPSKVKRTKSGRAASMILDHPDVKPAEAYLTDHHVDILQVGQGKGTYSIGKDKTGHGLPNISGKGEWTIREKAKSAQGNTRTVQFKPKGKNGLNPSHVNLDDDEHLKSFAKTLGHT